MVVGEYTMCLLCDGKEGGKFAVVDYVRGWASYSEVWESQLSL
jgi:hypothetical protein